jgi:BirA family biotin operon repressor/biotin-[acetyl-CoA-carboxylase] ligase
MVWRRLVALALIVSFATARSLRCGALRMAASSVGGGAPRFDRDALASGLRTRASGRQVEYHEETDSTMLRAAELLAQRGGRGAHGALVVADWQTGGVGRRGRSWESGRGQDLLFSLVWSPPELGDAPPADVLAHMIQLNLAVSVAVVRACTAAGVSDARVKWPNDVWARERKLAGSLVNFDGDRSAIIGIGLNVNEMCAPAEVEDGRRSAEAAAAAADASSPRTVQRISVRELLGSAAPVAREPLLAGVCNALEDLMGMQADSFVRAYREADMLIGRSIRVHHVSREVCDPRDFDCEVIGITAQGFLRVRGTAGEATLSGEEVSITPQLPGRARQQIYGLGSC